MGAVFKIFKPVILLGIAAVLFLGGFFGAGSDVQAQLTAFKNPLDTASLKTVLPTIGSALAALLSVWGFLSKTASPEDVAAVGEKVDAVNEAVTETRVVGQGESAKTRGVVRDGNAALMTRLDQLEAKLSPDEIRDLESAIADIMASKDARKAPAAEFLQEGDIEAAGDHLMKVARQEGAAADDIDKSARETYREAGSLFYATNTAKALEAYRNCVARGSQQVRDYISLSRLCRQGGQLPEARNVLTEALSLNPDDRHRMICFNESGDVAVAQGDLKAARAYYDEGLTIARDLATADPSNTQFQRDLSISYNKLGDVATAQGDLNDARKYYEDGLTIRRDLATADPSNTGFQRDLIISYWRLASLGGDDALDHWRAAREVVSALKSAGKLRPVDAWMVARIDAEIAKLGG